MSPSVANTVDIAAVRKLYESSPVARAVLEYFAGRTNSSSKTTLNRLVATLQADGHDVERRDVRQVLKVLAQAKCGAFVVGRKGHPSRFEWAVSLVDVGRAASGEAGSVQALKEPGQADNQALEDEELLEHRYRLRPDLELRIDLPANLTSAEAGRIADFMRTLPFR